MIQEFSEILYNINQFNRSFGIMEPIVHKSKSFKEAEKHDIKQHNQMSPSERQAAAKKLRERYFGKNPPDLRESHK